MEMIVDAMIIEVMLKDVNFVVAMVSNQSATKNTAMYATADQRSRVTAK
jgi:hypothetical protein